MLARISKIVDPASREPEIKPPACFLANALSEYAYPQSGGIMIESAGLADLLSGLTAKQRDVLDLLADNHTTKEIARRLGISPFAVDQRLRSAKGHIGPLSRGELTRLYRQLGGQLELAGPNPAGECDVLNPVEQGSVASQSYGAVNTGLGPLSAKSVLDQVKSFRFIAGMTLGFAFGVLVATTSWIFAAFTVKALIT